MGFFYNMYGNFLQWAGNIRIYPVGLVLVGKTSYNIKGYEIREIFKILKPGDVLLRAYENYLSSFFIPGEFSHAALYAGDNLESFDILHVMGDGLLKEDILTFVRADNLMVLRHKDPEMAPKALKKAWEAYKKGYEYDYSFDASNPETFYCSEFVDYCYDYPIRDSKRGFMDDEIMPDDFMLSQAFEIVWRKQK